MTKIVVQGMNGEMSVDDDKIKIKHTAVSYTHLTLPTKRIV